MADPKRPTQRERNAIKQAERLEETRLDIAEGRVKVRQMTAAEHKAADARHAAREAERAARPPRPGYSA